LHVAALETEWELKPAALRRKLTKREFEDFCCPESREESPGPLWVKIILGPFARCGGCFRS